MSILDSFIARIASKVAEMNKVSTWQSETADAQQYDFPDWNVYANQADLYRLSPILGTALDKIGRDVALSKINVKRMVGEEERDIPNHPLERLLRTPNPIDSGLEFMRDSTIGYLLNGNHVWWLSRDSFYDEPDEIWSLPWQNVKPVPDQRMYLSHYEYFPGMGKEAVILPLYQVVHFKNTNPHNRFMGLSPIESLADTITSDLGMRKTEKRTFTEYGGSPQSILAFRDFVPNEAWEDIKREKTRAAMQNEMMMLRGVGDGVTWMARAMSAKDQEFIEKMRNNMTDVFNRIAPGLLAMLDPSATEANAMAARATYSETLWAMLETFAQKVTSDILPAYERKYSGGPTSKRSLIAIYEDPRVVDEKLKLEKQAAFERSHTIEEVRKEFYGDDGLGDERDKLFVTQVNSATGDGTKKPIPPALQPFAQAQADTEETPPEQLLDADTAQDDVSVKAVDDLNRWRRMALKGKEKAAAFQSSVIPSGMMRDIKNRLPHLTEKADIVALFDKKIDSFKAKPKIDPLVVLQGLEQAVKGLELKERMK